MRVDHLTNVNMSLQTEIQRLAEENAHLKTLTRIIAVVAVLAVLALLRHA